MDIILPVLSLSFWVLIFLIVLGTAPQSRQFFGRVSKKPDGYSYGRKDYLMTRAENDFFIVLKELLQDRYQIFPQIHLSALLDHKVKGQNWIYAFRHINGKSVDFVVCDKTYSRPLLAIELDDFTHDAEDRRNRDADVERIFENANMPLLRFRDYKTMRREAIAAKIERALAHSNLVA